MKDEQDKKFPMHENLPKDKTSRKLGETNTRKILVLNSSDIIGCAFLMPTQYNGQKFQDRIVKTIDDHEKKLAQYPGHTQLMCLLTMINKDILCHTTTLSITLKIKRRNILCGN